MSDREEFTQRLFAVLAFVVVMYFIFEATSCVEFSYGPGGAGK